MNWRYLLLFFILYLIVRVLINFRKLIQLNSLNEKYEKYLNNEIDSVFLEDAPNIITLFKDVGVKDNNFPIIQPMGYGKIATTTGSVFENLGVVEAHVVDGVRKKFLHARGIYRQRIKDTVNPIVWLEVIFKLPEYLLKYAGVLPESVLVKILNIAYWLASGLFLAYRTNVIQHITK